jgi:sulfur relay (sulfurtransferase) DsrF/TusC family protein
MNKLLGLFSFLMVLVSCKNTPIDKPQNLIEEDKMINILYDNSVLQAIKVTNPKSLETRKINTNKYIFQKYKIDSLQFVKSDLYYASDADNYGKMYKKVIEKIENVRKADSIKELSKIRKKAI